MSDISKTNDLCEPLNLRFEQMLGRILARDCKSIDVIGTDSTLALGFYLSQLHHPDLIHKTNVVLVPSAKEAEKLEAHLLFFNPQASVSTLLPFDVSPYSGLYPNSRAMSSRVSWLHDAQTHEQGRIFILPVEAACQRTMPPSILKKHTLSFRVGEELPSDLTRVLDRLGYQNTPIVEDQGSYAIRGGLIDLYSPAHQNPIRIELFGDTIESLRFFNSETQRTHETTSTFTILPAREIIYNDDDSKMRAATRYREDVSQRSVEKSEFENIVHSLAQGQTFPGIDFLIGDFYREFATPFDHFHHQEVVVWSLNSIEISKQTDLFKESLLSEFQSSQGSAICPPIEDLYRFDHYAEHANISRRIQFSKIEILDRPADENDSDHTMQISSLDLKIHTSNSQTSLDSFKETAEKVEKWRANGFRVFISANGQSQAQRLLAFLEKTSLQCKYLQDQAHDFKQWCLDQSANPHLIHLIPRTSSESIRLNDEEIIFLRDEDFFGKKKRKAEIRNKGTLAERAQTLIFSDLKPGDAIVHEQHGIGIYEGLKVMSIGGMSAEFITLSYKDGDKLYLPIYRIGQIQKYSGPGSQRLIDKLGGSQWIKTKSKVRSHLREIAADLIQLYAKRSQIHRPAFPNNDDAFDSFEASFPYDETNDQLRAIQDIVTDMTSDKPMDRLVCGDVGFGKTEVAMRAAFKAIEGKKQVAVLAPTTVLSFQHVETFQKRFKNWPVVIRALNRFVPNAEARTTLEELREGKIDILIGTHRLLSKDVVFKDLGLLIIDEEQRFGVTHKEKIKKVRTNVDTLTLSATPIPRTLNMSLVGIRDLSIINTPPVDRVPTRTFVTKFDKETIAKAIHAETQRGGQVFFLHNRVQSIYSLADELKELLPDLRIRVGHGQMDEGELEKTMIAFFHHQVDVLVCTTIIESGIDNPRANTMFIDNAHQLGLSQLYQLRGRVGRSKERAYCYLLIPANKRIEQDAQERLKVIQENTALGSGIRIAHHDLELRGTGNLLGESQSGHIDAVGYEMYLELLDEAIRTLKGEEIQDEIEPEINVRIPALIPDSYISDIRIRLGYYKVLSGIQTPEDIERLEEELSDQFGQLPEPVLNLMGLMLIRHHCKGLGIRDLSSGPKNVSLAFTERTPLSPQAVVQLAQTQSKKYSMTPDMRLIVRLENLNWPNILEELYRLEDLKEQPQIH